MENKIVTYRNGQKGRLLCKDRPDTVYCVLSLRHDGAIMHNREDGTFCHDGREHEWDIVDGLQEPRRVFVVAFTQRHEDRFTDHFQPYAPGHYDDPEAAAREGYEEAIENGAYCACWGEVKDSTDWT